MSIKTSKVKSVKSTKDWNSPNGLIKYHLVNLENGDKINIGKKKQLQIGDEITYEIIGDLGQHEYTNAKSAKKEFKGGFDSKGVEVGHAINNAVNLLCAGVELANFDSSKTTEENIYNYAKTILAISKRLKDE